MVVVDCVVGVGRVVVVCPGRVVVVVFGTVVAVVGACVLGGPGERVAGWGWAAAFGGRGATVALATGPEGATGATTPSSGTTVMGGTATGRFAVVGTVEVAIEGSVGAVRTSVVADASAYPA